MNKPPEANSQKSLSNNSPEDLFAFLKCPKCKGQTFMQKSSTFYKCYACDASADVENGTIWNKVTTPELLRSEQPQNQKHLLASRRKVTVPAKELSAGNFFRSFSGMVVLSVILITFLSILSSERVENATEYPVQTYQHSQ
ncbi:hypothetical protein [Leptothoe sp. PORK10 BA2]|uniref:hypothetical protein n=1 Tax=Leptothoe sp. PORK10 BA2 TaxID=3110254 RepID=UPI002B1E90E4|nr:hypothetical protein [Leptothoe sp. PORK10 BA2]MEA5462204.1 hypothetical protein [Leptothoe sp. PORK10 BA2]